MKIAVIFTTWSTGMRPLNFNELFSGQRGLTGSDLGMVMVASEFVKLGHDVSLYTSHTDIKTMPATWNRVKLYDIADCNEQNTSEYDMLISWSDPDVFCNTSKKPIRVVYQMLNDFSYCLPGFDNNVDLWITVSNELQVRLLQKQNAPPKEKWGKIVPLGCEPAWYSDGPRVPGRIVWTSSADRGLHILLQEWPKIKAAVPAAHLRVFYNFDYGSIVNVSPDDITQHPHISEMGQRIRYMIDSMRRLKPLGVEHIGSVSRDRMAKELSEAMVLGYPCSTVSLTEGFSVSILESCAAGVLPVISAQDCLGSIYRDCVPMVESPVEMHLDEFDQLVVRGLTDETFRQDAITKCKKFAQQHTWTIATKKLEDSIYDYMKTHTK